MSDKIRSFKKLKEGETLEANVEIYEELDYRYVPVQPLQLSYFMFSNWVSSSSYHDSLGNLHTNC